MEKLKINGMDYDNISRKIYVNSKNVSDLSKLSRWKQPLKFKPNTDVLDQKKGGPCGFFASLQSFLCFEKRQQENINVNDILTDVVLSIFQRISDNYIFCEQYDSKNRFFVFQQTKDKNMAFLYIVQNNYLNKVVSCLLLLISYVFAFFHCSNYNSLDDEPFIYDDQMTSMKLAWLLLTGSCSNESLRCLEMNGYKCNAQRNIGIKVLNSSINGTIGTWLNPDASIFVCFNINHFFTVMTDESEKLIIIDNLNSLFPITVKSKKSFKWI